MEERIFLFDNEHDSIIWNKGEIITIKDDKVNYFKPNDLMDLVFMDFIMQTMNLGLNDRNNIRNYIFDLYDEYKKINK